jgi:glyoxylase-like metal-dependent hydrolase (beta-lactamase superfamily II)
LTGRSSIVAAVERPRKQEQEDASEEITEVAPNVLRMQLPIQMPGLGHVNMYALQDERGVAVVDPGLPGPQTWKAVQTRLGQAGLKPKDVHTVLVTHSHPDHFGTAGRLVEASGADLVTHAAFHNPFMHGKDHCDLEEVDPEDLMTGSPRDDTPWGTKGMRPPLSRRLMFRAMRIPALKLFVPPKPSVRLKDGEMIKLAGREWFAVHTPGHTLDHLCLHDPEAGLLLSGDHVLPTITPHIAGVGSGRDPLKGFVDSLDKVAALADVRTVLPAHGHPFADLQGRVDSIKAHHEERMDKLRELSASLGPSTVTEFSHHLFRKQRWGFMAESETYAHLEHLRLAGLAERRDEGGQIIYDVHPLS